jgi:hypothetical protein
LTKSYRCNHISSKYIIKGYFSEKNATLQPKLLTILSQKYPKLEGTGSGAAPNRLSLLRLSAAAGAARAEAVREVFYMAPP